MSARTLWKWVSVLGAQFGYVDVVCEFTEDGWKVKLPGKTPMMTAYPKPQVSGSFLAVKEWMKNGRVWNTRGMARFLMIAHARLLPCVFPGGQYVTITCLIPEPVTVGQRRIITQLLQKCGWWWVRVIGRQNGEWL
jgi:hypothetical protein